MEKREIYRKDIKEMIMGMQETLDSIRYSERDRKYETRKGDDN